MTGERVHLSNDRGTGYINNNSRFNIYSSEQNRSGTTLFYINNRNFIADINHDGVSYRDLCNKNTSDQLKV